VGFGPGFNGSILLVSDLPNGEGDLAVLEDLRSQLEATEGVAGVTPVQEVPNAELALMTVFPTSAPQDAETTDLVHRMRDVVIPSTMASSGQEVLSTGLPSVVVDFSDYTAARMPIFIGAVLLLSFLLLMMVFHSLVVPIKAVVMNLLGIGTAFGVMVAVFQCGHGRRPPRRRQGCSSFRHVEKLARRRTSPQEDVTLLPHGVMQKRSLAAPAKRFNSGIIGA
jgi:putative drug exporter of the RND superfamily